jgi:lipopolysaccharide transport system ATP-binding protein
MGRPSPLAEACCERDDEIRIFNWSLRLPQFAISVENLSKSYLVGHNVARTEQYTALRDVLARNARDMARKTADLFRGRQIVQGDEVEEFWALKDVSFEIERGERVGIIGRNGAGKSTLLKILSRITEPTKGRIQISGRVATLLEVGTGFHPELTGRENIFLNGAILGMRRTEIQRKFDEIVGFAEVEKFLDTPVKRYSSGMYVRLAFAVAAHLEPEILIVDEVLAVGDAQFQKKCLGRMEEIGRAGRTVLFVSHNMAMISSLCSKAIRLDNGKLRAVGPASNVILNYSSSEDSSPAAVSYRSEGSRRIGDRYAQLLAADMRNDEGAPASEVEINQPFSVRMEYRILNEPERIFIPNFHFYGQDGACAFVVNAVGVEKLAPGEYAAECHIPANFLNDGLYSVGFALTSYESGVAIHFHENGLILFNVRDPIDGIVTRAGYTGRIPGAVRPLLPWTVKPIH